MKELFSAIKKANIDEVRRLVEEGANVHAKGVGGETPFLSASKRGHLDIMKYLFSKGSDINEQDHDSWTALHFASTESDETIVQFLLENNANLELKTKSGSTALSLAAFNHQYEITKLLLQAGAQVNTTNNYYETPLMRGRKEEILIVLLEYGADPNQKYPNGETFLDRSKGKTKVLRHLIRHLSSFSEDEKRQILELTFKVKFSA